MNRTHVGAARAWRPCDHSVAIKPTGLEWLTLGGMLAFGGWLLGGTQPLELIEWQ